MARRYARDARGRFASTGKTAIGGRLTSKGGKRGERKVSSPAGAGGKNAGAIKGKVKRDPGAINGVGKSTKATKGVKASPEQRAIASQLKKDVRSKNIQATRILQKMAAKDGHGGDVANLTTKRSYVLNKSSLVKGKGNAMSATKSKDLYFDRAPSRELMNAAMDSASAGRISHKRLDRVIKAAGLDYMSINQGYDRAVSRAKAAHRRRRGR